MAWKDLLLGICTAGIWFLVVIHRYLGYLMEAGQRYDVELEDHRIQSIIVPLFAVIVLPTLIIYVLLFLVFAQKELNYLSGQLEGDPEI